MDLLEKLGTSKVYYQNDEELNLYFSNNNCCEYECIKNQELASLILDFEAHEKNKISNYMNFGYLKDYGYYEKYHIDRGFYQVNFIGKTKEEAFLHIITYYSSLYDVKNCIKSTIDVLKTVKMENKENTNFLSIESFDCTLNNGSFISREKILKNGRDGSAVVIYPITSDGKIIIAVEPRVFTNNTVGVDLPAGYIEDCELPIDAAKRELLEETGYTSDEFISIGSFYQDPGCSGALNYYFIAKNCVKVREQNLDKDEFIKYFLVTKEELDELQESGFITGINSAYAIEKSNELIRRREKYGI